MKKIVAAVVLSLVFGLGPLMGQEKKEMPMKDGMPMKNDSMMGKMKEMQGKMGEMRKGMGGMKGQGMMKGCLLYTSDAADE